MTHENAIARLEEHKATMTKYVKPTTDQHNSIATLIRAEEMAIAALREQHQCIGVTERLPTAEEYRDMHPRPKIDLQRWSEPKYLCPKCGGGMCKDRMFVLTSYPEQYTYECNQCGYTETQYR